MHFFLPPSQVNEFGDKLEWKQESYYSFLEEFSLLAIIETAIQRMVTICLWSPSYLMQGVPI